VDAVGEEGMGMADQETF